MRPELEWFANQMENVLIENDHKGGWNDCSDLHLFSLLMDEAVELAYAIKSGGDIVKESIDVANFCMMIADKHRH